MKQKFILEELTFLKKDIQFLFDNNDLFQKKKQVIFKFFNLG